MSSVAIVNCVKSLSTKMPDWLGQPVEQLGFTVGNLLSFLDSRSLFYGGSGFDGSPLRLFSKPHAVHCHLYADYFEPYFLPERVSAFLIPNTDDLEKTWNPAFKGYWPIRNEVIAAEQFVHVANAGWQRDNATISRRSVQSRGVIADYISQATYSKDISFRDTIDQLTGRHRLEETDYSIFHDYRRFENWPGPQFHGAVWAILERDHRLDDSHGPKRFAFLQVAAEACWTYWLLYGRFHIAPFALVLQDHGFGGNYADFGGPRSLLLALTQFTGLPPWLLRGLTTERWPGYETLPGRTRPNYTSGSVRVLERRVWEPNRVVSRRIRPF
jgi:hypothetical protein